MRGGPPAPRRAGRPGRAVGGAASLSVLLGACQPVAQRGSAWALRPAAGGVGLGANGAPARGRHGGLEVWRPALRPAQARRVPLPVRRGALGALVQAPRAFSGIGESALAIFFSELGDKTFFLAMILAIRKGRTLALMASVVALWGMTFFSTAIGTMLRTFPQYLGNQQFAIQTIAGVLMMYFGVQCFREQLPGQAGEEEASEKDEAASDIDAAISMARRKSFLADLSRFSVLIFLAEWGDRSMLATITIAATRTWAGTLIGGCLGHLAAACLAVFTGTLLERYLSDQVIKFSSGVCFIVFGVLTLFGIY